MTVCVCECGCDKIKASPGLDDDDEKNASSPHFDDVPTFAVLYGCHRENFQSKDAKA